MTIEDAGLVELIEAHQGSQGFGERPRGSHATWIVRNEVAWAVLDKARAAEARIRRLEEALKQIADSKATAAYWWKDVAIDAISRGEEPSA